MPSPAHCFGGEFFAVGGLRCLSRKKNGFYPMPFFPISKQLACPRKAAPGGPPPFGPAIALRSAPEDDQRAWTAARTRALRGASLPLPTLQAPTSSRQCRGSPKVRGTQQEFARDPRSATSAQLFPASGRHCAARRGGRPTRLGQGRAGQGCAKAGEGDGGRRGSRRGGHFCLPLNRGRAAEASV